MLTVAIVGGRQAAATRAKKVWSVIGTGTIGILMKAPAATSAVKSAVTTVLMILDLSIIVNL